MCTTSSPCTGEVSEAIAREIHAKIDRSTTAVVRTRVVDPDAWVLYMRGRYFWARVSPDNLKKARDYFQQAIDKQADFALAYAGLADAYLLLAFNRVQSPLEAIPEREPPRSRHWSWMIRSPRRTPRSRVSRVPSTPTGRQRSGDTGVPSSSIRTTPLLISGGA